MSEPGGAVIERVCGHGESIVRGRYVLLNNLWGASRGAGRQCVRAARPDDSGDPDSAVAWGTDWDWTGPEQTVKSYAAAVRGWHWGWPLAISALPVRLDSVETVEADWSFELSLSRPGVQNVSFDIWLAAVPDPSPADLVDEVMIWLWRGGGATPIGAMRERLTMAGADWELWQGPHPERGWQVHSFVRVDSAMAASIDLRQFFDALKARGMRSDTHLVGIQAGTEVFTGAGTLETKSYRIRISTRS